MGDRGDRYYQPIALARVGSFFERFGFHRGQQYGGGTRPEPGYVANSISHALAVNSDPRADLDGCSTDSDDRASYLEFSANPCRADRFYLHH